MQNVPKNFRNYLEEQYKKFPRKKNRNFFNKYFIHY